VLVLAFYPLFAVLRGELLAGASHVSLIAALKFQLVGRASTGSPLGPSSGSAALVGRWLSADPWLLGAGVLAAPVAVVIPRLRVAGLAVALPVLLSLRPVTCRTPSSSRCCRSAPSSSPGSSTPSSPKQRVGCGGDVLSRSG